MNEDRGDVARTLGLNRPKAHRYRPWIWGGAAVVAVAAFVYLSYGQDIEPSARYQTVDAARADLTITVSATGTIEPTNLVEISSELSGTLETVHVDYNDLVERGTVLASLDTRKLQAQLNVSEAALDAAIARVAMAQASLEDAREKFTTAQELDRRGVLAHQTFTTRKTAFDRAGAELLSAEADRDLAEATLELHQAELDLACICSPVAGIVLSRNVDPGQIVAASLSAPILFTLAEDLTKMELQVDIDEADIGRVSLGNSATFTVDAYDDRAFPAEITEIRFASETIDGVVTYKAILDIDNAEMLLRPGMTASAEIIVDQIDDALVVPNAALRFAPPAEAEAGERSGLLGMLVPAREPQARVTDSRSVWILRAETAVEIPVQTGASDGQNTQILSGDLSAGDLVITDQSDG